MTAEQANRARERKAREQQEAAHLEDGDENRNLPMRLSDNGRWERDERDVNASAAVGVALGAFSIGLGLAEIIAPRQLARLLGVRPSAFTSTTMRLFGLREIAAGVGMIIQPRNPMWAWARVAGDVVDLAALTRSSRSMRNDRARIAGVAAATIAITGLDLARARQLSPRRKPRTKEAGMQSSTRAAIEVHRSVTVNRPVTEVYEFWRQFENFPQFMDHLESVTDMGNGRTEWTAKAPAGTSVTWEAELIEDQPNQRIAWQSTANSEVPNAGSVSFVEAPGNRGTEVHVQLSYSPPAGKLGAIVAKLFGEEPNMQVASDLRRFKQVLETGEVLYSDASIHKGMHPARPSEKTKGSNYEAEQEIVVERAADAADQSSNRERESTTAERNPQGDMQRDARGDMSRDPQQAADDRYNDELANHRSTF